MLLALAEAELRRYAFLTINSGDVALLRLEVAVANLRKDLRLVQTLAKAVILQLRLLLMVRKVINIKNQACLVHPPPRLYNPVPFSQIYIKLFHLTGFKFGGSVMGSKNAIVEGHKTPPSSSKIITTESNYHVSEDQIKKVASTSEEFLQHLSALNRQFSLWIQQHVEKNPYVLLAPCLRDYEKHLKTLTEEYQGKEEPKAKEKASEADKPMKGVPSGLLAGVFGQQAGGEPITNKQANFSFGSSSQTPTAPFGFGGQDNKDTAHKPNQSIISTTVSSGFSFGNSPALSSATGSGFGSG